MKQLLILSLLTCVLACIELQGNSQGQVDTREIRVHLKVPDPGWELSIQEIHQVGQELWVLSMVKRRPGKFPQVITTLFDQVRIESSDLPVVSFVTGKTWNWSDDDSIRFIDTRAVIAQKLGEGKCLFQRGGKK